MKNKVINYLSLFSGIGAYEEALKNIGVERIKIIGERKWLIYFAVMVALGIIKSIL